MSPLAAREVSGAPPGSTCRCKVPESFCDRADTSPKQLTNKQTNDGPGVQLDIVREFEVLVNFDECTVSPLDERREVSQVVGSGGACGGGRVRQLTNLCSRMTHFLSMILML